MATKPTPWRGNNKPTLPTTAQATHAPLEINSRVVHEHVGGRLRDFEQHFDRLHNVVTHTADTVGPVSADASHIAITCATSAGGFKDTQVRLPPAASVPGRTFRLYRTDGSASVATVLPHSTMYGGAPVYETINGTGGASPYSLTVASGYNFVQLLSDGTGWVIVG